MGSASGVVSYIGTGEDYETRSDAYTLTVRATDGASAAVFTAAEVTVLISNENDNAPLFAAAPYSFTVPEGQSGTQSPVVIGSVSASDADGVAPLYSLSAGATERFSVGSASGVVSYIGTGEDYETRSDAYTLTVRATDGASAAVFTAAEVTVLISNENDNAPLFAAAPYSFTVPEGQSGTQSPVVIGSVSASDADGVAPLYSLSAGATERFSVGSASGVVSYIGTGEDFETRSDAYTLTVRATDGASAAVFTAAEVTVLISNENDNAPLFAAAPYSFTVPEGQSGTQSPVVIGSVSASDADGVAPLYSLSAGATERFSVGSASGVVSYIGTGEDYETRSDAYTLTVRATDGASAAVFTAAEVTVLISNENDNAPLFAAAPYSFTVPEGQSGTQSPVVIGSVSASDADGVAPLYSLSAGATERFSVGSASGVVSYIGTGEDYETRSDAYTLTVRATDGASAAVFTAAEVTVLISNENDNAPLFAAALYSFTVPEGQSGTQSPVVIGSVSASDADGVAPLYSLSAGATERFSVGSASGVVSYIGTGEDYETRSDAYTLTVRATDGASAAVFTAAEVTVLISNENDNAPLFAAAPYSFTVPEGQSGTQSPVVIGSVSASDADGVAPLYSLSAGATERFSVGSASGVVSYIGTGEDYETRSDAYTLTVRATDGASAAVFTAAEVTVLISNENDNAPLFAAALYSFTVPEGQSGTQSPVVIGSVSASDADGVAPLYSLSAGATERFSVGSASGVVSYIGTGEDYETRSDAYTLTVRATDGASAAVFTAAEVTVLISNENDNAPLFAAALYSFTVPEGQSGTQSPVVIGSVSASDADGVAPLYSLSAGATERFSVGSASGVVSYIGTGEDYETRSDAYTLTVRATDGASAAVFTAAEVTVLISNENDNAPLFAAAPYSFTVPEGQSGTQSPVVIGSVSASDADGVAPLYSLSAGATERFSVGSASGVVSYIGTGEDYETRSDAYTLTVRATDGASAAVFTAAEVTVLISNENDNAPLFAAALYSFTVPEGQFGTQSPVVIGSVSASDADGVAPLYSLSAGATERFSVGSASGVVSYIGTGEDFETRSDAYTLTVRATDGASAAVFTAAEVTVLISNENDNAPLFAAALYSFTVPEGQFGTQSPVVIGSVSASDADGVAPLYSLSAGATERFSVGSASGVVSYIGTGEDYETRSDAYTLTVRATDGASAAVFTAAEVTVLISNENDNAPLFAAAPYSFTVPEGQSGTQSPVVIGSVSASDADGVAPLYSLSAGATERFSVGSASGVVSYIGTGEDFETRSDAYTLTVRATDGASAAVFTAAEVTVLISNENDNAPLFAAALYSFTVNAAGLVGTVVATDANGGTPSYSLVSGGSGVFSVGETSGVVEHSGDTVSTAMSYTLVVSAQDAGGLSASAMVEVVVTATAVAPAFAETSYVFTVNAAGLMGTVVATDANGGTLSYSLVSGGSGVFSVVAASGVVSYSGDTVSTTVSYTLVVSAQDAGGLSVTAAVTVEVTAIVNTAPAFEAARYTFSINDTETLLGSVQAMDADGDVLIYSLVSGGSEVFSVAAASGVIEYNGGAVANDMSYILVVSASDGEGLSASAVVLATVRPTVVMGTRTQRVAAVLAGVGRDAVINAAAVFEGRFDAGQHITVSGNALKLKHWANGARASELTDQWGGRLERQWAQLSRWMDWDYVQRSGEWSGKERELSGDFGLGKRWERLEADWQRQFDGYRAQWNKFRKGLVSGSSFLMPLGASEGGASAGLMGWTVWGRGHASGYERVSDGLRLKGRSLSGYLGADYQATKALLLGVALSHSTSEGHSEQAADGTGRIDVDTAMAAVWPYANWDSGAGLSFWGALGHGTGTAELDDRDEQDGVRETDVEMSAVLFGVKRRLLSLGGVRVSVKADGFVVAMESDAVVGYLNATNSDVHQLRLALSANNRWRLSKTARSRAGVELGVRADGGDAVKGQGLDIGAQVGYSDAALGLAVSSRVRLLVAHSEDYHEWGLDAIFELKPGLLGRGLALKLIPRWGQVTQANKLWADGITALRRTNTSGRGLAPDRAQLLLSYGLGYGGVELRPYTSVVMRRDTKSDMSLGVKLNKGRLQFSLFGNQVRDFGASGMLRW